MLNEKQKLKNIESLTRDELLDILYVEYVREKIRRGEEDLKHGRFMTLEESKRRLKKKHAEYIPE